MGDEQTDDDVSLTPGQSSDPPEEVTQYIRPEILDLYDVYSYRHAASLLANSFPSELDELQNALEGFRLSTRMIGMPGGNESEVPKVISRVLRSQEWLESRIQGDLLIRIQDYMETWDEAVGKMRKETLPPQEPKLIPNFIDGHKIDYVKGKVAFDLEWNSKDQTFDRDLYAMRAFHETGLISAGVLLTRSETLNPYFNVIPQLDREGKQVKSSVKAKYGASTTWMGKLLYRLNAGRHGGCPILALGIRPSLITDLPELEE